MAHTPEEAGAALAVLWDGPGAETEELSDIVSLTLENPALPMLLRAAACARVVATSCEGLSEVVREDGPEVLARIHRLDMLDVIAESLRETLVIVDALVELKRGLAPPTKGN